MKNIAFFLFTCAVTVSMAISQVRASQTDSINYIDDEQIVNERLLRNVSNMIAENPNWGISTFRSGYDSAVLDKKIMLELSSMSHEFMSADDMYSQRVPSVLMLGRYYDCGNCPSMRTVVTATAVVLTEDGVCLTNNHVIEGLLRPGASDNVDSVAFVATLDGDVYPILEVLSYSKIGDLAIFRVDTRGDELIPIPLGNSLQPGVRVRAISHPNGNFYYYSDGVVARNTVNTKQGEMSKRMEITADYAIGSSGGPIFDKSGNLVGLVSTTQSLVAGGRRTNRQHQMTIKQTVPVVLIRELLKE